MLPAYFGYYAQSNQYFREVSSTTTGTTRTRISRTNLGQIRVPAPTLPEQQRIVGILDKAFENIAIAKANTEKNIANARELFQSARRNILSPCEHAWAVKSLGSLCVIKTGKRDVNEGNPLGAYPFFTCAKQHTYSDSYSFDTEAILIAGNGDVGTVSYYSGKFEAYQRTYVLATFDQISARLVFMQLEAFLKDTVSKQKLGNTMPYIKLGMLSDFPIALPPQEERAAITTLIEKTYTEERNLTDLLDRKLSTINELKRSLLAAAFNGEL
jgi:type I restriction enzyme S subunit